MREEERPNAEDDDDEEDAETDSEDPRRRRRSVAVAAAHQQQRRFVADRLGDLRRMDRDTFVEVMVEPILKFFVASLCDLKISEGQRKRIGLRYARTPEVENLMERLANGAMLRNEIAATDPNVIISVLKNVLSDFPGGIFDDRDEEFLCVSLQSSLDVARAFVDSLVRELPTFLHQFTYLVCKSLRNLARQSAGNITDSYTDLLLLFTPILFPNSVGDVSRFLRATRVTLILVDSCDSVFKSLLSENVSSLSDSAYHSDEDFFQNVLNTLNELQDSFHESSRSDSCGTESDDQWLEDFHEDFVEDSFQEGSIPPSPLNEKYYQITFI